MPDAARRGAGAGGWVWYPNAHGRGQFSHEDALARWPLAGRVYAELERTGPASATRLAERLGISEEGAKDALWWLTFADDNGTHYEDQMVHGHLVAWSGRGRRTSVRFVHRTDLVHGCEITDAVAANWRAHLDRQAADR